jgi:hypothetical protein
MRRFTPRQILLTLGVLAVLLLLVTNRLGHQGSAGIPQTATGGSSTTAAGDLPFTTDSSLPTAAPSPSSPAAAPHTSSSAAGDNDGADDTAPVLVQPTSRPDVQQAAAEFTAAWLNTFGQSPEAWRQGLLPRVTAELAAELAGADPGSVPAGALAGKATVTQQESLVTADVDVLRDDTKHAKIGVLTLTMLKQHGTWMVSQIDWAPVR